MRTPARTTALTALFAAVVMTLGCGDQPNAANPDLEAALTMLDNAAQGYAAQAAAQGEGDEAPAQSLQEYRQANLDQALPKLEAAVQSASGEQEAVARRLLAEVHAAAARHIAGEALEAYAKLGAGAKEMLMTHLRDLTRAASHVEMFEQDRTVVQQKLNAAIQQQQAKRVERREVVDRLQSEIEQLQAEHSAHREQAATARQEQQALRDQANTVEGGERYDLLDEAAAAGRRADEAEAEAEKVQAQLDIRTAELGIERGRIERADAAIADLNKQLETWRQREAEREQQLAEAQARLDEAGAALVEEFEAVRERFMEQVHQPLHAAGDRLTSAVEQLERARGGGTQEKLSMLQDELTRHGADHRRVLQDFGQLAGMLAERVQTVAPERAGTFTEAKRAMNEAQQSIASE